MDTAPCWPQTKLRLKGALIIFVYALRKHAWKDQWDGHRKEIKTFKNFKTLPLSSLVLERSRAENMPWLAMLTQLDTTWHLWKKNNSQTDAVQSRQTTTKQKMTEFRILLLDTWQSRIHLVVAPFHHSPLNTSAQRTITPRLFKTRTVCAKVPLPIQAKKTKKEHEEFQWSQPMELTQHSPMTPCSDHGVLELKSFDGRKYKEICRNQLLMVLHLIQSQATEHTHSFGHSNWNLYRYKVPILTGRPRRHDAATAVSDYGMSYGREKSRNYWPMLLIDIVTFHSAMALYRIRAICRSFPFLAASWHWGARSLNCQDKWCDEISTFRDREGPATIATFFF